MGGGHNTCPAGSAREGLASLRQKPPRFHVAHKAAQEERDLSEQSAVGSPRCPSQNQSCELPPSGRAQGGGSHAASALRDAHAPFRLFPSCLQRERSPGQARGRRPPRPAGTGSRGPPSRTGCSPPEWRSGSRPAGGRRPQSPVERRERRPFQAPQGQSSPAAFPSAQTSLATTLLTQAA